MRVMRFGMLWNWRIMCHAVLFVRSNFALDPQLMVGVRVFVGKKTLPSQQLSKHRRRVMLGKDATPASVVASKVDML